LGGISAFGVGKTLSVFGVFRIAGDETLADAGVLGGNAGKSEATVCLMEVSKFVGLGSVSFIGCITRLFVGTVTVTVRLAIDLGPDGVAKGVKDVLACFFAMGVVFTVGLLGADAFAGTASFGLPGSREGKSSGCKVRLPWVDIALVRPVLTAKDLTSRFACTGPILALGAVGVAGTETFDSGVAARGTYTELVARDGVKAADVGKILDVALPIGSEKRLECAWGDGWACGR